MRERIVTDPASYTVRADNVWWEIGVPDLGRAREFYGEAFGWTFEEMYDGFLIAKDTAGAMVGGLERRDDPLPTGSRFNLYFASDELEAVVDGVVAAGGSVVLPRTEVSPEYGWYARVADPFGTVLGITTEKPAVGGDSASG